RAGHADSKTNSASSVVIAAVRTIPKGKAGFGIGFFGAPGRARLNTLVECQGGSSVRIEAGSNAVFAGNWKRDFCGVWGLQVLCIDDQCRRASAIARTGPLASSPGFGHLRSNDNLRRTNMKLLRLALCSFIAASSIWAQRQYVISTVAGGAPALTPGPAVSASIGAP